MMTILRDPLQEERTAYELLGVRRDADDRAVKNAFKMAFAQRKESPRQLQQANKDLLNPAERVLIDATLYDEAAARRLGLDGGTAGLDFANRPATAESWRQQLSRSFPDFGLIHSLGVLWYWAAVHAGDHTAELAEKLQALGKPADKQTGRATLLRRHSREAGVSPCNPTKGPACPVLDCPTRAACMHGEVEAADAWRRAIAYWSALLAVDLFWETLASPLQADPQEAKKAMEKSFHDHLFRQIDRFQGASAPGYAEQLQQLTADLDTELKTARQMAELPGELLGLRGTTLGAGRLLLQEVEQLAAVRRRLDQMVRGAPQNRTLQRLQVSLSPYANIDEALRRKRWEEALRQLESLDPADRQSAEAKGMEAQALVGLGQQQAALGNPDAALKTWKQALAVSSDRAVRQEAQEAIEQSCLERAAVVEKGDPDEAVLILEAGLELTGGTKIKLRLGEILSTRAIKTFNDVQRKIKNRNGQVEKKEMDALNEALKQLERAVELGSDKARENLQTAREAMEGIGELQWVDDVNSAIATFNEVQEAISRRGGQILAADVTNLRAAVRKLESAAKGGSQKAKEQLPTARQVLAQIEDAQEQSAWAADARRANEAAGRGDWDTAIRYLREALKNVTSGAGRKTLSENLAVSLTNRAVGKVNDALETFKRKRTSGFDTDLAMALIEAKSDLEEAAKLDPSNSHVKQQLSQVSSLMDQMVGASTPGYSYTPSRSTSRSKSKSRSSYGKPAGFSSAAFGSAFWLALLMMGGAYLVINSVPADMVKILVGAGVCLLGTVLTVVQLRKYQGFGWCWLALLWALLIDFTVFTRLQGMNLW